MVRGIDSFRDWFHGYENCYVIIGGTACDLLMEEEGLDFRATKDVDMVLIIEAVDGEFVSRFWDYVRAAGYDRRNKSTGDPQFYRFSKPMNAGYPAMIGLFSRVPDVISLPGSAVLTPLPIDEEISSLSAILLNADYYEFMKQGMVRAFGVTVLNALCLIPFKAKAWMELSERKAGGEHVDSRHIRKHRNDVFRLTELLEHSQGHLPNVPEPVRLDMRDFVRRMAAEDVNLKQLGIVGRPKEEILDQISEIYG
ncbi:MAG: hypothetical protein IJ799_08500 [Bacteroidales bacterium]|nr:hypothetical protein [Bacteroidales bacterium]